MRAARHAGQFKQRESAGARAIADSLDLHGAPVLQTGAACKSGLAFLELVSGPGDIGTTEPIREVAAASPSMT